MIWIFRILYVIAWLIVLDMIYGVIGLILCRFSLDEHPRLYRAGLRALAMSETFGKYRLPAACQLDCKTEKCGNWTCPRYNERA